MICRFRVNCLSPMNKNAKKLRGILFESKRKKPLKTQHLQGFTAS